MSESSSLLLLVPLLTGAKDELRRCLRGLGGRDTWRDSPQRRVLYRRKSRCVAFISVPCGLSIFGHIFSEASSECGGGRVIKTSYSVDFIARIESVVHAIQPQPSLSRASDVSEPGVVTAALEIRRSSSRRGMSWTPIEKRGRRRWGGAVEARRSSTASGILDKTERSYTERRYLAVL